MALSGVQCEAIGLLRDLKESFSQLYEDIEEYKCQSRVVEDKITGCREVLREMQRKKETPVFEREVRDTLEETERLLHVTNILTRDREDAEDLRDLEDLQIEEQQKRDELEAEEATASTRLTSEHQEITDLHHWQSRPRGQSLSSNLTIPVAPASTSTTGGESQEDALDIEVTCLLEDGTWKAKQDSRGHTYYYKTDDKKVRVWNLKKHLASKKK